jgi:pimeloyl-ACP methyl ester carboxylesterase
VPTLVPPKIVNVAGVELEIVERGQGRPILLLHGAGGPRGNAPFMDLLDRHGHVVAPSHPGFGGSPLPEWVNGVDDLAYIYLDLLDQLDWHDVVVIGMSMGGWTACEIATKNSSRLAKLILVDPVGIKVGDRETRDLPDIYALHPDEVNKLMLYDPSAAPDYSKLSDEELLGIAKAREAAVLYLWEPYMHNPQLRRRLHRVTIPTMLLRGEADGLCSDPYARAYAASIPGAKYEIVPKAGHSPQTEQPEAFVERVAAFMGAS